MDPLFNRDDDEIAAQILEDIAPVIELGDRLKHAAKQLRRGNVHRYRLEDFDCLSFHIMCDFAESILEELAPALEEGCYW